MPDIVAPKDGVVHMGLFTRQAEHHVDVKPAQHLDDRFAAVQRSGAFSGHVVSFNPAKAGQIGIQGPT